MNWDEIEKKLAEYIHSQEVSNLKTNEKSKNKVWARISWPEMEQQSGLWTWLAAASVLLIILIGSGLFYNNYQRMKSENKKLAASIVHLKESNKALMHQLQNTSPKPVSEIPKTIVYKTNNPQYNKPAKTNIIKTLTDSSKTLTIIEKSKNHDSTALIDKSSEFVTTTRNLSAIDRIEIPDSTEISHDNNITEANPEELITLSMPERQTTKKNRFRISLGSYKNEPTTSSWKVTLYSR